MNAESEMAGADGLGTELEPPEGCTGAVMYDRAGKPSIQHDAGTCPIHEIRRLYVYTATVSVEATSEEEADKIAGEFVDTAGREDIGLQLEESSPEVQEID